MTRLSLLLMFPSSWSDLCEFSSYFGTTNDKQRTNSSARDKCSRSIYEAGISFLFRGRVEYLSLPGQSASQSALGSKINAAQVLISQIPTDDRLVTNDHCSSFEGFLASFSPFIERPLFDCLPYLISSEVFTVCLKEEGGEQKKH